MNILQIIAKTLLTPLIIVMGLAGYDLQPKQPIKNDNQISILQQQVNTLTSKLSEQKTILLGSYNPSGGGTYRLRTAAGSTDSSINLSSFKEPISNIPYTMGYLNSAIGYGTLDPQTTKSEFISFSGITQNIDGTAKLTGVVRGLSRSPGSDATGCTVASSTLRQTHSGQSIFILSNSPCFYSEYAVKQNNENITGAWTIITPTSANNPATKAYVDLVAGGSATTDKVTVAGTAGETITAGQVLYLKQADTRWYKASVSIREASTTVLGIAQGSGTAGVAISGGVLISGVDTNQTGLTSGSNYFLSSTAGTISTATTTRIIGRAKSTTSIYFNTSSLVEGITTINNTFTGVNVFNGITIASSSVTIFNGSGTWTKATQGNTGTVAFIEAWGGGGAGGARATVSAGGGGGGSYNSRFVPVSLLGATETVTVGAGGVGAGGSSIGASGATSTFGAWLSAPGGGGGNIDSSADACGGGGGGPLSGGGTASGLNPGEAGLPGFPISSKGSCTIFTASSSMSGAGGGSGVGASNGGNSLYGGAGGGGINTGYGLGGTSTFGGNGGNASSTANGSDGSIPGGGGGASLGNTAGSGGSGRVKITIF